MRKILLKTHKFLSSLGFAIVLLILIAAFIVIGTVIPQHLDASYYLERYGSFGKLIVAADLDTAYSSPIFMVLAALFTINLVLCTFRSLKGQLSLSRRTFSTVGEAGGIHVHQVDCKSAQQYFTNKRYTIEKTEEGFRASTYTWGVWGATIVHIGIIIIMIGGVIGAATAQESSMNLLPGNEIYFDDKGFSLRLDDFSMTFTDTGTVSQYVSDVTITDDDGSSFSRSMWVNNPLSHKGVKLYQASYGWANNLKIVDRDSQTIVKEGYMLNNSSYFHQDSHLSVYLYRYYPELGIGGNQQPINLSERERNPHYAVTLYQFGNPVESYIVGPHETIPFENLDITFTDSQAYTGLLFRSDSSFIVVSIGFVFIILGMIISFYFYPRSVVYGKETLTTYSRKNNWVYAQSIAKQLHGVVRTPHGKD
ncbi:MAG: cytochrome c biogenesis protein ResB [Sphaerochaetaceae bacterium]|jgi:cytochrome c biogenesis protein|nr:cytochrome c biogenesis protein ResB [Sphaerochaetaceae bacterium]MDX9809797.1 cytochrome c biogenesis protein ResB [Sphaerochaetaceae bacterium]